MNLFKEFITDEAPKYYGVHSAHGITAALVYEAEIAGTPEYSMYFFPNLRERVHILYAPYIDPKTEKGKAIIDALELSAQCHYKEEHKKKNAPEIEKLERSLRKANPSFLSRFPIKEIKRGWWDW